MITILKNKKIFQYYTIIKKYQAGIILYGWEIQSIKYKNININNSYIEIKKNKIPYLIGTKINPIQKNYQNTSKTRKIKILLKKKEINSIYNKIKIKGYTLILISLILKKPWYKIIIGLSKGKKKYDKKKYIKEKENKKLNKNIDLKIFKPYNI